MSNEKHTPTPRLPLETVCGGLDKFPVNDSDQARLLAAANFHLRELHAERNSLLDDVCRLQMERDTPHTTDFIKAVELEALHQRARWAADHDAGKTDADWFWLIGYLAGKALNKPEKQLHHIITTAAACLNWHAGKVGADTRMRPGTDAALKAAKGAA